MPAGMSHDASNNQELERERTRAKTLCHEFISVSPAEPDRSIGSFGCNMRCPFCQNDSISQRGEGEAAFQTATPAELADTALRLKADRGNIGLAYTYNEPLVGWEFVRDCAREVRARGMANALVSNGCAEAAVVAGIASISPDIPLHVTRFFPRWRMADAQPTPVATVRHLADVVGRRLRHVLTGNCKRATTRKCA